MIIERYKQWKQLSLLKSNSLESGITSESDCPTVDTRNFEPFGFLASFNSRNYNVFKRFNDTLMKNNIFLDTSMEVGRISVFEIEWAKKLFKSWWQKNGGQLKNAGNLLD